MTGGTKNRCPAIRRRANYTHILLKQSTPFKPMLNYWLNQYTRIRLVIQSLYNTELDMGPGFGKVIACPTGSSLVREKPEKRSSTPRKACR